MENKFKNICEFYSTTMKLKELIRSGWKIWDISAPRLESVAEHIYGTQMLAFAVNSEFELGMDLQKVVFMLAFHELGECVVGDITLHDDITKEQKHKLEEKAVIELLEPLKDKSIILQMFNEFEENKSKEARFCHQIDKLECDLWCKYYDEGHYANMNKQYKGSQEELRQNSLKNGINSFSQMWINYDKQDKERVNYDELFQKMADYIIENKIFK